MRQWRIFDEPLITLMARDLSINNQRLLLTRWVAGLLVLGLTFICVHVLKLPLEEGALYLLGITILLYNALLVVITRHIDASIHELYLRRLRYVVILQVVLDWIGMAAFVHLTGGISSPAISIFFIHVLMVTILIPGQSPYIYVLLAVLVVLVLALLEDSGLLPHHNAIPRFDCGLCSNPYYISSQVIFFGVTLFTAAFLANGTINRLRERELQIALLLKNMRNVTSSIELEQVLKQLTQGVAEALSVSKASIRLLGPDGEQLTMAASYGLSDEYLQKGLVEVSQSDLDRKALSGQVVIIDNASQDARVQYPQEIAAEGIHSMLVVPIIGRHPLGVLRVYAEAPRYFRPKDAEIVQAMAFQSASAIENAMVYDTLQNVEQQRTQFILHVTHELRAPVTGAKSLLRVLLDNILGEIPEKQRDILARLENRMDSLLSLIHDLLALANSKSQLHLPTTDCIELEPIVMNTIDKLRFQADEKNLQLDLVAPDTTPITVIATEEGLSSILENVIGNAVKYTPQDGKISVEIALEPPSVLLIVRDNGIGIPQNEIDHLGDEFYRASNVRKSDIEGTGLGLAIVKHLVSQFGGFLSIQSDGSTGTTVTITLRLKA